MWDCFLAEGHATKRELTIELSDKNMSVVPPRFLPLPTVVERVDNGVTSLSPNHVQRVFAELNLNESISRISNEISTRADKCYKGTNDMMKLMLFDKVKQELSLQLFGVAPSADFAEAVVASVRDMSSMLGSNRKTDVEQSASDIIALTVCGNATSAFNIKDMSLILQLSECAVRDGLRKNRELHDTMELWLDE